MMPLLVASLSCATACAGLILELLNLADFPILRPQRSQSRDVVACVAVRNGATDLRACVESLLCQDGIEAVVVVDDGSTDETAAILEDLSAEARVRRITARSEGKSAALAAAAASDTARAARYLFFTDVDVRLRPGAIGALIARCRDTTSQAVSAWPSTRCTSAWDTIFSQCLVLFLLQALPMRVAASSPDPRFAAGNGQLFLVDRMAYDAAGGHAACTSLVEDVELAQKLKTSGSRIALASGASIATTSGYGSLTASVAGYGRSLLHGAGRSGCIAFALWQFVGFAAPFMFLKAQPALSAVAIAANLTAHGLVSNRMRRASSWFLSLLVGGFVTSSAALWIAVDPKPTRWHGRLYKRT